MQKRDEKFPVDRNNLQNVSRKLIIQYHHLPENSEKIAANTLLIRLNLNKVEPRINGYSIDELAESRIKLICLFVMAAN